MSRMQRLGIRSSRNYMVWRQRR